MTRVLLIKTSSLGDVVHCLPAISDMARNVEALELDWVIEDSLAEIARLHPAVSAIVPVRLRHWRRHLFERVTWRDGTTGETSTHAIRHVFVMTGASPGTEWLKGCLALDDKGFIRTGRDLDGANGANPALAWPLSRPPQMLETSLPGVFAVGDARSGNVKRVASAVGEGAIAVHLVHRTLTEM